MNEFEEQESEYAGTPLLDYLLSVKGYCKPVLGAQSSVVDKILMSDIKFDTKVH